MKINLLLVALLSLACGCTPSTREVHGRAQSAGLSSSSAPAAPRPEPAPPPPARPVVYFVGAFKHTGTFAWTNGMTLQDGIDVAGGFAFWANHRLRIQHPDRTVELYRLDRGKTFTNNPALRPEDLVLAYGHIDTF